MRRTFAIIAGGLSVTLLSAQGPTLPSNPKEPPPLVLPPTPVSSLDVLKKEREALARAKEVPAAQDDEDATTAERRLLRKRLEELLEKLKTKPAPGATPPKKDVPDPKVTTETPKTILPPPPITEVGKAVDAVAQATALYRNGEIQAALGVFGLVDLNSLTPEDRAFVKYMKAGCHRRLNNLVEAARLYNEIITDNTSEFYIECSTWQLSSVRWRQDLEKQLADLRQRREAVPPK
jgi:hypothetical protein